MSASRLRTIFFLNLYITFFSLKPYRCTRARRMFVLAIHQPRRSSKGNTEAFCTFSAFPDHDWWLPLLRSEVVCKDFRKHVYGEFHDVCISPVMSRFPGIISTRWNTFRIRNAAVLCFLLSSHVHITALTVRRGFTTIRGLNGTAGTDDRLCSGLWDFSTLLDRQLNSYCSTSVLLVRNNTFLRCAFYPPLAHMKFGVMYGNRTHAASVTERIATITLTPPLN